MYRWLETYTGVKFHLSRPLDDEIVPEDIAHALSMLCRYNGHTQRFFSVAEHCCLISDHVAGLGHDRITVLGALLHDATETYIGDMCSPVKEMLPDFRALEENLEHAIARRFGIPHPRHPIIKDCDRRIVVDEHRQAMSDSDNSWELEHTLVPLGVRLNFWTPTWAETQFLSRYYAHRPAP